jgi:hypothetical protein
VILSRFHQLFTKSVLYNAFSNWRSGDYRSVIDKIHITLQETQLREERHFNRVNKIKAHNASRAEQLLSDFNLRNMLYAWRNVSTYLKLERHKTILLRTENQAAAQRNAVLKWQARVQKTKEVKETVKRIRDKARQNRAREVYTAMKEYYYR